MLPCQLRVCVFVCEYSLICFLFLRFSLFFRFVFPFCCRYHLSLTFCTYDVWVMECVCVLFFYWIVRVELEKLFWLKFGFLMKFIRWFCSPSLPSSSTASVAEVEEDAVDKEAVAAAAAEVSIFALNSTNLVANKQLNTFDSRHGPDNWLDSNKAFLFSFASLWLWFWFQ